MRDPKRLFARYGRQLLVEGADFAGQARLHGWTAVLAGDATPLAQHAAEACGRYLVGAGVGAVVAPSAFAQDLQALDPQLRLLDGPGAAMPPVAHYWFAERPYGASVDLAVTDDAEGYAQGQSSPARVVTLRLELGEPATLDLAVVLGAAAADLLLADVLGLEALPAIVAMDWRDPHAPRLSKRPHAHTSLPPSAFLPPPGLLAQMRADPQVWQPIAAEVERGYPAETCGLVVRQADDQLKVIVCPNLQDRYHALDPQEFPRTARTAYKLNERVIVKSAEAGETLLAIWHSHCDAGAYFSAEDVRCAAPGGQALFPGVGYLVLSVLGGALRAAALYHFDSETGGFVAE
jgi:proteasome lid subunit RPN8/RPN11